MLIAATARLLTCAVAALVLVIAEAHGDDVVLIYRATWSGLAAGRIRVVSHTTSDAYRIEIATSTEGLPWTLSHFRSTAVVEGKLAAGQRPEPVSYLSSYDLRKRRDRQLRMGFISRDGAVFAERLPGDTSRKPVLAEQFRRNVIDPISSILAVLAAVHRGEPSFTVPVYDGARRFDTLGRILPRDPNEPGIHLALVLKAIAGFKGESSDDPDPDDAPRPVKLVLADDARLTPLSLTFPIWYLPLEVKLVRVCEWNAPCGW
ncbi:MAG TPA: DUF3108 domain-containing protein [Stellaceae bacterium]|nr:DUF3108 domain-containing protein [Stellaceae bacterium]